MPKLTSGFFIVFLLGFSGASSAQLPPEIMADKYLIHAEQLHAAKDYAGAFDVMRKIVALQKAHNLKLPDDFHFKYARVAVAADSLKIALESVSKYLSATGKDGEFYDEALVLLLKAEGNEVEPEVDFYNDVIKAEGTCHDALPEGTGCWKELTKPPECYVWDDYFSQGQIAIWTGKCSSHALNGTGTLTWYRSKLDSTGKNVHTRISEYTGPYLNGKRHGEWVYRESGGRVWEGLYVNGKKHGQWVWRHSDGAVGEGPYVNGERHGQWVTRRSDGDVEEGPYVNGMVHGQWVTRRSDGSVSDVHFVDGKRHGKAVFRSSDGVVTEGHYRGRDGSVPKGHWRFGLAHGHWVSRDRTGRVVYEGHFVDDEKHGEWIETLEHSKLWTNFTRAVEEFLGKGFVGQCSYKRGTRIGQWIYRNPKGDILRLTFTDGDLQRSFYWYDSDDRKCRSVRYDEKKDKVKRKKVKKEICLQWVK